MLPSSPAEAWNAEKDASAEELRLVKQLWMLTAAWLEARQQLE